MKVWNVGAVKQGGTRQADRPASTVRWGREASTDHSHEDGERAVDAVLFTGQDPRTTGHRGVPAVPRTIAAPGKPRNTRGRVSGRARLLSAGLGAVSAGGVADWCHAQA